jgi:hypothetical protein
MAPLFVFLAAIAAQTPQAPTAGADARTDAGRAALAGNVDHLAKYVRVAVGWHVVVQCSLLSQADRSSFERDVATATKVAVGMLEAAAGSKARALEVVMSMQQKAKRFATDRYSACGAEAADMVSAERREAKELAGLSPA